MIYFKILRLPHQILCLIPLFLGILDSHSPFPLYFTLSYFLASTAGFAVNEYVDSFDTDRFNNRVSTGQTLNKNIVSLLLFLLISLALLFFYLSNTILAGVTMLALMFSYSVPPIRIKKIPVLDIVVQTIAWAIIPYSVPFLITGNSYQFLPITFLTLFLIGAVALAPVGDITADKMGKIYNSTVVLGYKKSLTLGFFILFFALCLGPKLAIWYQMMVPPGMLALGVYGYARGNVDRPEKLEKILKLGKKWGTRTGYLLAIVLLFIIIFR